MRIETNESVRRSLIKKHWLNFRRSLAACRQPIIDKAEHVDPERLKAMLSSLFLVDPLKFAYIDTWSESGGKFFYDMERMLKLSKGEITSFDVKKEDQRLTDLKNKYKLYANERSAAFVESVQSTQVDLINNVIDEVLESSLKDGMSIEKTRKLMQLRLADDNMLAMENYQAERIARTEVIGASNKGSFDAATEMNIEGLKKAWLTSGLQGVRPSHQSYEGLGAVDMKYEYNSGLKFPGDPRCDDPADTINCRCTIVYEIE